MEDRFNFRAWDKEQNCFKYGLTVFDYLRGMVNRERYILEQCTGLKDKNGKLIYEGDIVKLENETSEVKWCINGFAIDGGVQYLVDDMDIEVIGNIHENKNLE